MVSRVTEWQGGSRNQLYESCLYTMKSFQLEIQSNNTEMDGTFYGLMLAEMILVFHSYVILSAMFF
jgi:hypothetical protein